MSDILLATKVRIPPLYANLVNRSHLVQRLNEGFSGGRSLTLISSPAGYGKSTLLSEWVHQLAKPVAWISLDKGDNSPFRFWSYFATAIHSTLGLKNERISEVLMELGHVPTSSATETAFINLIAAIADLPERIVLILDDLHLVTESQIHDGLIFLVENLPPPPGGMHLVIASRMDPPWPLARWRVRSALTEMRVKDLRFSPQEATTFLNDVMKLNLAASDVTQLDQRTEGWIAGLQMAALSLQGRREVKEFIKAFTGSNRYIFDYLMEEVLERQPAEIQEFLLNTSILARLSAPLCDAVLGRTDSREVLDRLEKANLFLMPLDDVRQWYRYHHLFSDLLFRQLEQTQPLRLIGLHRQAAEWFENNGFMVEAVNHALAGKDYDHLVRLVKANAYAVAPLDLVNVAAQLDTLPEESGHSRPWAQIAQAWAWVQSGHLNDVVSCLKNVENVLGEGSLYTESELKRMRGHIAAIHGYRLAQQHDMPQAIKSLRESLAILPMEDTATRSMAATILGTSLGITGCLAEGSKYGEEAVAMGRLSGSMNALVDVLGDLASLQYTQGKLNQAARTCQEAMQIAETASEGLGQKVPVIGWVYLRFSLVLREWNALEEAWEYTQEALQLCKRWGHMPYIFQAYFELAKILQVAGKSEKALYAIQEAERVASNISPWYSERAAVFRPWQQLLTGNISAAAHWAQTSGLSVDDRIKFEYFEQYCLLAKVLLATGKQEETVALVDKLLELAHSAGAMRYVAELLALKALVLSDNSDHCSIQGKMDSALPCLEQSLAIGEPEGYMRIYIEKGPPMVALLRHAQSLHLMPAYVNKLLDAFDAEIRPKILPSQKPTLHPFSLLEPLSSREMEILRLLKSSMNTPEIAAQFYISVGTVRTHVKNIYRKLDVNRRMDAVQRAKELGLV